MRSSAAAGAAPIQELEARWNEGVEGVRRRHSTATPFRYRQLFVCFGRFGDAARNVIEKRSDSAGL